MQEKNCDCMICKNHKPIDIPIEIIQAAKENNLVFFCGAGISTESKTALPFTFFDQITDELDESVNELSFSETMSFFVISRMEE